MKCLFCPQLDTVKSDFTEVNGVICYTHDCPRCKTNYFVIGNLIKGWQFCVMEHKRHRYWISWTEDSSHTEIKTVSLNNPGTGMKKIISIPGQANLTPHNVLQKLPTILTFL
jgi:hypothetical protein